MSRLINWFEIPVTDFARARRFYETVLKVTLREEAHGERLMGVFPYTEPATGGAIARMKNYTPGPTGVVIYLDGGDDLAAPLARVETVGGSIVMPKTEISPEIGCIALFRDTEGNVVGLHSRH
jgi:predicted enzyme related to lactoylglutathione lyase